ncbi:glucose-1-phosphate thymidylyltransferase RfbA [Campylobacter coli]|uniref:glucose-1-phosphate thymidylyltransferase RfbA n=1 Tax=Campylobacter coli TaxID=195 RepID=UPI00092F8559|nr:glucose-1-phosphate thymidylyltransferase RfbA [Campylobacter coli]EAJ8922940.1 glucose-1-phosphate thymidylyltransferase RfbA [Campylobacter coli]EEP2557633.1 glucose-1-phosphate thymidylyltransferase RfbA [Campylobacter coli]EEP2558409.1 glucose-1-phosphate thymidylyltransferase RfbA [Campylobacter coli]EIF1968369.1 glucose-1-phosphate thymidylyltransferase RfbA [Campylobacter coli]EKH1706579.1 glucose-1-phosphate thymidylyltransferase RfbA [Campylobacter coli]
MKGIILAGGSGTRLYPITLTLCKQLLPIYDKPMIYYPLSVLMLAKIREVLIISTPKDTSKFQELFGDGSWLGMEISYCIQEQPKGLAEGLILADNFIKNDDIALILGDNIFYGQGFSDLLQNAKNDSKNGYASIFSYHVKDPERFGVAEISKNGEVLSLEEKPQYPKSNYAVTGLYFYDNSAIEIAKSVKPSSRGELEITDVNIEYLKQNRLKSQILGRGFAWIDTGTHDSLIEASEFVQTIELRQGYKIACLEEIAFRNNWIDERRLLDRAKLLDKSGYGVYLRKLLEQGI